MPIEDAADARTPTTLEKAAAINRDARAFGSFAEIGAGQEVVRWFFHAGEASATVAKSLSAYDTAVSDDLYGPAEHYVSRERLESMLDHEFARLLKRSDAKRGDRTCFFVFADTVATRHDSGGHGWLGIRFQTQPRGQPSDIIAHAQLLDPATVDQQTALGILGANLLYGAYHHSQDPSRLIASLTDNLPRRRLEIDLVRFSGPAFPAVDNRLMSLKLVEHGLTDAVMFTVDGEVEQPSEVLAGKPVLLERGAFRPVTNITQAMLDSARAQLQQDATIVLMEMTLNNLLTRREVDPHDFLARVDTLGALGKMVLVSTHTTFDRVVSYLRKYTKEQISIVLGAPTLIEIFQAKYYADLEGGRLEGLGRLFRDGVKLFVYPTKTEEAGPLIDAAKLSVPEEAAHLYSYLLQKGQIEPIHDFSETHLHISPGDVLSKIQSHDPVWEKMVPSKVVDMIKQRNLFGY